MNERTVRVIVCEVFELVICPPMPPSSPEALSAALGAAINAGDVPAALELWVDDPAILQAEGQMLRGGDAIGEALRALVENEVSLEIDVTGVFATAEVAVAIGTLTMRGVGANGRPFKQDSCSVVVYHRGPNGAWRLAIDAPWGLPGT